MNTNDNQYTIYIRSTGEKIPATKEEFDLYYRDIDSFRRKQQRHGRCVCPKAKRLSCDMDCFTCPFRRAGDERSLDYTMTDSEGYEMTFGDTISTPSFEQSLLKTTTLMETLQRVMEVMPEAFDIAQLRLKGLTEQEISEKYGISRQVLAYRLKKVIREIKAKYLD